MTSLNERQVVALERIAAALEVMNGLLYANYTDQISIAPRVTDYMRMSDIQMFANMMCETEDEEFMEKEVQ